ncbi:MAG: hypothetical protein Q4G28_09590 [Neisseria sp.]|nr:hypothetical protein [Neisseria sp.]
MDLGKSDNSTVMPTQVGIHVSEAATIDSGLRRNDDTDAFARP